MAQDETARGDLFFELRLPPGLEPDEIEDCKREFEEELDRIDPYNGGDCKRNKWLDLHDVPTDPIKMPKYINDKLKNKGAAVLQVPVPAADSESEEVIGPPPPITYCYPGPKGICYHAYPLKYKNGDLWKSRRRPKTKGLTWVMMLTYETPDVFPKRELEREKNRLEDANEKLDLANKEVGRLKRRLEVAEGTDSTLRKTGS